MRPLAKIPFLALLLCGCALGQAAPASAPKSPMSLRMDMVQRAAEQTDPTPELEQLCDEIGPRLTGTVAQQAAERQVIEYMHKAGLRQVHTEGWTLPRGWQRGPAAAWLVTPFQMPIPIAAYGWTGSTPAHSGPVQVVLVRGNDVAEHLDSLVQSQASSWSGKALLVGSDADRPMRAYSKLLPLLQAATAAHAVVVLRHDTRPGDGIVHSEPVAVALPETIDTSLIPSVDLPVEHQKLIERLLLQNRAVSIDINVENSFSAGPVPSANMVGEIEGAVHPEKVVLVGAHLDSWDLGTGATDDGFGVAAVLGAAKALVRSGLRPARTLRFVLFTGEEEGLLGSRAYVRQHAAELGNIVAVFALDWGAGPIVKLPTAGHPELLPLLRDFNELTPDLHLEPPNDGWLFMTDAYAFTLAGLPGIAALVRATQRPSPFAIPIVNSSSPGICLLRLPYTPTLASARCLSATVESVGCDEQHKCAFGDAVHRDARGFSSSLDILINADPAAFGPLRGMSANRKLLWRNIAIALTTGRHSRLVQSPDNNSVERQVT